MEPVRYYTNTNPDGSVTQVHIADIHFGAIDPRVEYEILRDQFLIPISKFKFDILAIDGDLFDKKFLANSPVVMYAMTFVRNCVDLCIANNATLVILAGTESHDAGQLSLFYGMEQFGVDIRIVEHLQFEYIKGLKVLCIPEEYGKGAEYYAEYMCNVYDCVFMHGTVVGSVYGANKYVLDTKKAPVFSMDAFCGCRGPIIAGHVHKAACIDKYIYYTSNPIRYKFGEEEEKGYAIVLMNQNGHFYKFMPIKSFRYDTIKIEDIQYGDPNDIINYLNNLLACGIDHVRIDFSGKNDQTAQSLVEKYYASNPNVAIKRYTETANQKDIINEEASNKYSEMEFLLDPSTDSFTKFVNFVNQSEGKVILTVQQLKDILSGKPF